MNKVTVILGKATNKKMTNKIAEMTKGKKVIWGDNLSLMGDNDYDEKDNCVLVYEGLSVLDLPRLKNIMASENLIVRMQYGRKTLSVKRPEMIIISKTFVKADFKEIKDVEFIEI